jgi:hypothetical protein
MRFQPPQLVDTPGIAARDAQSRHRQARGRFDKLDLVQWTNWEALS